MRIRMHLKMFNCTQDFDNVVEVLEDTKQYKLILDDGTEKIFFKTYHELEVINNG